MEKEKNKKMYADIWGDTVDLKHLAIAIIIGIAISLTAFLIGFNIIKQMRPDMVLPLQKAMGLIVGIFGCIVSAIICAKLFPPKRTFSEQEFTAEDRERMITELNIDPEEELEAINAMSDSTKEEMQELEIYDMFKNIANKAKGEK